MAERFVDPQQGRTLVPVSAQPHWSLMYTSVPVHTSCLFLPGMTNRSPFSSTYGYRNLKVCSLRRNVSYPTVTLAASYDRPGPDPRLLDPAGYAASPRRLRFAALCAYLSRQATLNPKPQILGRMTVSKSVLEAPTVSAHESITA
jgi:hypothetical protein